MEEPPIEQVVVEVFEVVHVVGEVLRDFVVEEFFDAFELLLLLVDELKLFLFLEVLFDLVFVLVEEPVQQRQLFVPRLEYLQRDLVYDLEEVLV